MAAKLTFAGECQSIGTDLGQLGDKLKSVEKAWFSRGYNTGGTAIVDADVASLGITAADVAAFITMIQQLQNFLGNAAVTTADYQATVEKMRTDH